MSELKNKETPRGLLANIERINLSITLPNPESA